VDLIAEIRRLDGRIKTAAEHLTSQLEQVPTTLTEILRVGTITAAKILGRTGPISRFPTEGALRRIRRRGTPRSVLRRLRSAPPEPGR
jgi:transposase